MQQTIRFKHILLILAIFLTALSASAKPFNVLILHSYQQEFPKTKIQHDGFVKGLRSTDPSHQYNIFTEYLNAKTSTVYAEHPDLIDSYIQTKYILNRPDIIYATNDEAATYLSKTNISYLKEAPLVLSGITEMPDLDRHGEEAGILINYDVAGTIKMINTIFTNKPKIIFIDSGNKATWIINEQIERFMKETGSNQDITMEISRDINMLIANTKGDDKTIYVLDNAGGFYNGDRHETFKGALVELKNSLPSKYIFNMHEIEIKSGLLGGLVISGKTQGDKAGKIAALLALGRSPGMMINYIDSKYIFDRQAIEAVGVKLPESINNQAIYINNHSSFIEKYGSLLIWIIILLVILLLITSITISIYISKQHKILLESNKKIKDLSRQNQQYIDAVDASNLVSKADSKGVITYINDTYLSTIGYRAEELVGKRHNILNHPDMDSKVYNSLVKTVSKGDIWAGVLLNKTKDNRTLFLETSVIPIKDEDGNIFEYLSVRKDITQVIRQQKEIQSQYTDVLTGLPNRIKMRLDRNNSTLPAVALLNIDGFSIINTFYGMEAGDYLLKAVAEKIKALLPDGMNAYRVSGDEFGILAYDTPNFELFNSTIQNIMDKISFSKFIYEENEMHFTLTTGTSIGRPTTITKAGIALRQARLSKKSFMTYDEAESEMEKIRDTVLYSGSLRYALMNDKIIPYFQPIVETETGKISKYEALMRIEEANGNILPPDKFLYMSKKIKLYNALSTNMMEKTIRILSTTIHSTCINFDIEDIMNPAFQTKFFGLVQEYKLQGRITVEITESEGTDNMDEVAAFLAKARQHGCLIAIDDFGTGYSNFMYILSLQPDFLKIDGSITRQINVSPRARLLTQTISDMCKQAGIKTVAEYVSSEEIYETIKEVGIDYCQGYLFGKPSSDFKIKH